jgi:hypothetical protein
MSAIPLVVQPAAPAGSQLSIMHANVRRCQKIPHCHSVITFSTVGVGAGPGRAARLPMARRTAARRRRRGARDRYRGGAVAEPAPSALAPLLPASSGAFRNGCTSSAGRSVCQHAEQRRTDQPHTALRMNTRWNPACSPRPVSCQPRCVYSAMFSCISTCVYSRSSA